MDPNKLPLGSRLTWLVGPPGAGKSTLAKTQVDRVRVVEFDAMLRPLIGPPKIRKGVLQAHTQLVKLIRDLERHPENTHLPPVLLVAGIVSEQALFPLGPDERVWLVRPDRERWHRQLTARPVGQGSSGQYDDYEYSALWWERFGNWGGLEGVVTIDLPFQPDLLGEIP